MVPSDPPFERIGMHPGEMTIGSAGQRVTSGEPGKPGGPKPFRCTLIRAISLGRARTGTL